MKFVSFIQDGRASFGALLEDGHQVADLGPRWGTLRKALPDIMAGRVADTIAGAQRLDFSSIELDLPITDPDKIICAGLNFLKHVQESGFEVPRFPSIFLRSATTFAPHDRPILKPDWAQTFDYEAELAIIIGKAGRYIPTDAAGSHVAGYTLLMDGSVREVQFDHSLSAGKNYYRSGAIGPWMVTADEVADLGALELVGRLNGQVRQRGSLSDLIFDVPALIAYCSRMTELLPGDIISVGTPSGVGAGMKPPAYMSEGDVFETEVPGIGLLRNRVETDPLSL